MYEQEEILRLRSQVAALEQSLAVCEQAVSEQAANLERTINELQQSEARFRAIYEGSGDAIMLLTPEGFFDCNQYTLELFGVETKEAFTALHPADISPPLQPDGRESLPAALEQIQIAYQQGRNRFEWLHRRTDGTDFPAEVLLSAFKLGKERVLQGTVRDITERKQVEQALRDSETRYSGLVKQAKDGVLVIQNNILTFVNQALADILGYASPEELIGTHFIDHVAPVSKQLIADRVRQRLAGEDVPSMYEAQLQCQDGTIKDVEVSGSVIEYQGQLTNLGLIRDITERKQLEAQITESLARRGQWVQTTTEIAQEIAAAPELEELFERVVTLIKDRFDYYHAQVFRYDPDQDAVVLVTGYGEPGRQMLVAGHTLPMGRGVVGTAAATGRSILASDAAQDKDWRPNRFLPDTKGELAVPIKLRDRVLGILDVQSDRADALTQDDQLLLESLCGQIAIAIEQQQLREAQAEEHNLMRTIIDTTPDWIFIKDREHRYRLVNKSYADAKHLKPEDVIGKNDLELGSPEELVKGDPEKGIRGFWADDRQVLETGETHIYPDDQVMIDGVRHIFHTIKAPLRDATGQVWGVLAFARDVTERDQAAARMEETMQELERLYRASTREGWQALREAARLAPGYQFDQIDVRPVDDVWTPKIEQAVQESTLIPPSSEDSVAVAPLTVRGEIIGALGVYDDPQRELAPDELDLLQEILEQGSLALESARLYQDSQRRAAREQLVGEVTAHIRETLDVDKVLQTALREIAEAMGASKAEVRLGSGPVSELTSGGNGHDAYKGKVE
ncbi:MAG: PAS domain S-box protein [Anaerolineae bacterium]|nr:PAS domain S-box protein [Anaerolineae bacterium]